jgi:hypothetical protein
LLFLYSRSDNDALFLDVNGIAKSEFSYPPGQEGFLQPGFDFLHQDHVSVTRTQLESDILFLGPFPHPLFPNGVMHPIVPIWLPAATEEEDFGCGPIQNCSFCWNSEKNINFFGLSRSMLDFTNLLKAMRSIKLLEEEGVALTIRRRMLDSGDLNLIANEIIYSSDEVDNCRHESAETFDLNLRNLRWEICSHYHDQQPSWYVCIIAGIILLALVLSLCLLIFCTERYHAASLLEEILPRQVISHLKTTMGPYAEKFDNVTILFCDIVGFTPLAVQLDSRVLIVLLDELYCAYDKLTEKHKVYKVETIGNYVLNFEKTTVELGTYI